MAPASEIRVSVPAPIAADLYLRPHPFPRNGCPVVRDVIYHIQARRLVDPVQGIVYSRLGKPAGGIYKDGYVRLPWKNDCRYQYAHRVIWSAVHGEIPAGLYIDHLNGRKADNRIINLDAVTPSQNAQRAVLFGSAPTGEERSDAKLTNALVLEIRSSIGTKTTRQWARDLGVDPATIRSVRQNRSWRHVPPPGTPTHKSRKRPRSRA